MDIIPTIFSKNKKEFAERLHRLVFLGKNIQIDIMDGKFVSSTSVEVKDIPDLTKYAKTNFEAHLMVKRPENYIDKLKKIGIKKIIFHIEPFIHDINKATKVIHRIKRKGMHVFLARNPQTPIKSLFPFVDIADGFLFMGIPPGKEGQKFMPTVLKDIMEFKLKYKKTFVQVDGGVNPYIAHLLAKYDVNAVNSGSYISTSDYPEEAVEKFERSVSTALDYREMQYIAHKIRKDIILMLHEAKTGHPAGALGLADAFTVVYFSGLFNINPRKFDDKRDYVFLSNGHVCPVLYATLAEKAFMRRAELLTLRKIHSRLQGHPHLGSLLGVENTSGPLGQGISVAVGTALALKLDKQKNKVLCFCGDGELDEGQVWEALMCSAHNKLDNFTLLIDRNHIQIDGFTQNVLTTASIKTKLEAFNFDVHEVHGHNLHEIHEALHRCQGDQNYRPKAIILQTIPGRGVSFMENKPEWHGKAPNDKEALKAIEEIEHYAALLNHTARKHMEAKHGKK